MLAPHDPSFINLGARLTPPVFDGGTWEHPLDTDDVGRDFLSRLMHWARLSLIVVGIVVPGSALFGTLAGMTSGWKGGATGQMLMRIVDIQLALPGILFALLLGSIFGPSLRNVIIMTLEVAIVIQVEAALGLLGVGVPAGTASWGRMITEGREVMIVAWWPIWLPGLALLIISLTGNLMGDWLRDRLDPRLRHLH